MLNLRKLIFTILCLSLYSCGFQVIYKERENKTDLSYVNELAAVRIKKNRTLLDQELKNNLYDLLNPEYLKVEPKYFLTLSISKVISPTFITITGSSGRNKVTLDITYQLQSLETGELISSGSTSVNDNYDVTTNRYGTYTADEYVQINLAKTAAQNIRNYLVNDFIEERKRIEKEKEKKTDKKN